MQRFTKLFRSRLWRFISRHGLLSILFLASLIRLAGLGFECLWYDEAFTATIAALPFQRALAAIAGDVHPPLYYAIEWLAVRLLGNNEFVLRLPSAILGVAVVYQVYQLAIALMDKRAATFAALLVAVLPVQLYYSQEARMYTLLTWLVLFAATSIARSRYLAASVAMALILYTQNLGLLYVAALGAWMLAHLGWRSLRYAPIGLTYLPWLPVMLSQARQIGGGFWIVPHGIGQLAYQLIFTTFGFRIPSWMQTHVLVLVSLLTCVAAWQTARNRRLWPLWGLAVAPPVLMWVISTLWAPVTLERALLPSGVALGVLWIAGISKLDSWHRALVGIMAAPVLALSIVAFAVIDRDDFRSIAQRIGALAGPHEAVYHTSVSSIIFLGRYIDTSSNYLMPSVGDLSQSLTDDTQAAMGIKQRERELSELPQEGYTRAWILIAVTPSSNDEDIARANKLIEQYPRLKTIRLIDNRFGTFDAILLDLIHSTEGGEPWKITRTMPPR